MTFATLSRRHALALAALSLAAEDQYAPIRQEGCGRPVARDKQSRFRRMKFPGRGVENFGGI